MESLTSKCLTTLSLLTLINIHELIAWKLVSVDTMNMATTIHQNIVLFFILQTGTSVADKIPLLESQTFNFLLLS
jgi:phage gp29-like protein